MAGTRTQECFQFQWKKKKKDTKKQLALQKVGAELGARRSGFTPISQQSSHSACSAFRVRGSLRAIRVQ